MGKNQSASNLTNVIQVSSTGNVLFVSGSTTLMSISSSGAITTTGVISGSNVLTASYANNAELLDGLDSTAFATTGAYSATSGSLYTVSSSAYATSGSLSATSGSLSAASGSFNTRVSALEATGSALSSSILSVSSSAYATSGSLSAASGSFNSRVASLETYSTNLTAKTASFATTGSNTFIGSQVVSGSLTASGSITATGTITAQTLVVQTITSSVVYSSGSNVFGNDIGNSQRFTGSMFITGSNMTANVGTACFAGQICASTVVASTCLAVRAGSATLAVNNIAGGAANNHVALQRNDAQYASIGLNGSDNFTVFGTSTSCPRLTIDGSGLIGIGTTTPARTLEVCGNNTPPLRLTNSGGNVGIEFITGGGYYNWRAGSQLAIGNSFEITPSTAAGGTTFTTPALLVTSGGNVGIGCTSPGDVLTVGGNATISTASNTTLKINGTAGVPGLAFSNASSTNYIYGGVGSVANIAISPGDVYAMRVYAAGCVACLGGTMCARQFSSTFTADGDNMAIFINNASTYSYGAGGVFIGSSTAHDCLNLSGGSGALIIRNGSSIYTSAISYNGTAYFCNKLGIGVPNPTSLLHVAPYCYSNAALTYNAPGNASGYSTLRARVDQTYGFELDHFGSTYPASDYGQPNGTALINILNGPMILGTNNNSKFIICANGTVNICCNLNVTSGIVASNFQTFNCSFNASTPGTNYDITNIPSAKYLVSVNSGSTYHWNGILALSTFDSADFGVNILTCGSYSTNATISVVGIGFNGNSLRMCFSQNIGSVTVNFLRI